MNKVRHSFRFFLVLVTLIMVPVSHIAAQGPATELFMSEYVEGGSNNKAIEIYNGTGATVDLAAGVYTLEFYFNGANSAGTTIALTGTIADGDVYVIADDNAVQAVLDEADQTPTNNFFNGDDTILLLKNGVVIDSIGQLGNDPGSQWGSGDQSTQNNTLRRKAAICAGDTDASNAFDPATEWDGFAQDTFDGLGSHTATCGGGGQPADLVINEFVFNHTGTDTSEFIEVFGDPNTDYSALTLITLEGDFDNTATGTIDDVFSIGITDANGYWTTGFLNNDLENGTVSLLLVDGFTGSAGDDLDTNEDGTLDTTPWSQVVDAVAVNDGDAGDLTYVGVVLTGGFDGVSFTPGGASRLPNGTDTDAVADWARNDFDGDGLPCCTASASETEAVNTPSATNTLGTPPPTISKIHEIQGSGPNVVAGTFTIEAIVVGDFQGETGVDDGKLDGFFVQEEDADADGDPATSEGIFVFCGDCPVDVMVGNKVMVTGASSDFFDMSQLTATGASDITVIDSGNALPTPATLTLPVPVPGGSDLATATAAINAYYEQFEGMLVSIPQPMTVVEYFQLGRFGEVVLAQGGRLRQFTDVSSPDANGFEQHQIDVAQRTIKLDDDNNNQNDALFNNLSVYHPQPGFSVSNFVRGGDTIDNVTGTLHWSWAGFGGTDAWRIRPVPEAYSYSFNADNPREGAPTVNGSLKVANINVLNYFTTIDVTSSNNSGDCGPSGTLDCRGADSEAELQRQTDKLVAAICGMDSDIVGLVEIENNASDSLNSIVTALNAQCGPYAFIDTGAIGTDAIKVGLIYKPATVATVGPVAVLDDVSFTDPNNTGQSKNRPVVAQTFSEIATGGEVLVAVNHLKSKGSGCGAGDDDITTGQANCNGTRTAGATAEAAWLATDPTGTGVENILIIGDLNAYRNEDPIVALENAGYTDLIDALEGASAYSFVFNGQLGYLDYAMANAALLPQVTDIAEWHINADEVNLLDYNDTIRDAGEASFEPKPSEDPLYDAGPYRASDHDPVIVGLDLIPPFDGPQCNGVNATIYVNDEGKIVGGPWDGRRYRRTLRGTNGDDVMVGTDKRDIIQGRRGNDLICALDGRDNIFGQRGDDTIFGDDGRDRIDGGRGTDICDGGDDRDRAYRCETEINIP